MINDVDEALRRLLIQELPIKRNEVDIDFEQPRRETTSRWNKPTISVYLYDLRQNKLRQKQQQIINKNGQKSAIQRRPDIRFDLHYVMSVWTDDADDEHYLLTRILMALCRYPHLPEAILPQRLQDTKPTIPLFVAEPEEFLNPADLWGSLDNELHPAISCLITFPLNPYESIETPLVRKPPKIITERMDALAENNNEAIK